MTFMSADRVEEALKRAYGKREETGRFQVVYLISPAGTGKTTALKEAMRRQNLECQLAGGVLEMVLKGFLENTRRGVITVGSPPDLLVLEDCGNGSAAEVLLELEQIPSGELLIRKKYTDEIQKWCPVIVYVAQADVEQVSDSQVVRL